MEFCQMKECGGYPRALLQHARAFFDVTCQRQHHIQTSSLAGWRSLGWEHGQFWRLPVQRTLSVGQVTGRVALV